MKIRKNATLAHVELHPLLTETCDIVGRKQPTWEIYPRQMNLAGKISHISLYAGHESLGQVRVVDRSSKPSAIRIINPIIDQVKKRAKSDGITTVDTRRAARTILTYFKPEDMGRYARKLWGYAEQVVRSECYAAMEKLNMVFKGKQLLLADILRGITPLPLELKQALDEAIAEVIPWNAVGKYKHWVLLFERGGHTYHMNSPNNVISDAPPAYMDEAHAMLKLVPPNVPVADAGVKLETKGFGTVYYITRSPK